VLNNLHKIILIIRSCPTRLLQNTAIGGRKIGNIIRTILLYIFPKGFNWLSIKAV
jgi:hypothetical protein